MEWNESARLTLDCECRARKSAGPVRSNGISKATSATFSNKLTDRGPIKKGKSWILVSWKKCALKVPEWLWQPRLAMVPYDFEVAMNWLILAGSESIKNLKWGTRETQGNVHLTYLIFVLLRENISQFMDG
jgi:hypothetical protein